MDLKLLEYFLRISELGSINKAAVDLHLSQPALSRHIAALEHEMGTALFNRTQGGVNLTEAGTLLADRARTLLRQFTILKEQVGVKAAGQIAIGIPTSWQHVFTSSFVELMLNRNPGVALRVYEGLSHALRDYMFSGLLDLCIAPFDAASIAGYKQTMLMREPLVLVGSRADGMRSEEPLPLSRLQGLKLVLPARPNALRALVEHSMLRKGMDFRLGVEADTLTLCLEMARRGIGFAVVPAVSLHGCAVEAEISWAPIRGLYLTWALCENSARTHSQAVREGRRLVISTLAESLRAGAWFGADVIGNELSCTTSSGSSHPSFSKETAVVPSVLDQYLSRARSNSVIHNSDNVYVPRALFK